MITVDARALSFVQFNLTHTSSGFVETLATANTHSLDLRPGRYKFGTLFGPAFIFDVTAAGTVVYDPNLTFLLGMNSNVLKVNGFAIHIDATALTLDHFSLSEIDSGMGETLPTAMVHSVNLLPGKYKFGTLFGPTFLFLLTAEGNVAFDPALAFLDGAGTDRLIVRGFAIHIDATTLTLDQFALTETNSGLGTILATGIVQSVALLPGDYRFGTLFGPVFAFAVSTDGKVALGPDLNFLSGAGSTVLTVRGFPLEIDATSLGSDPVTLTEANSGLSETLTTATVNSVHLIPGSYRLTTGIINEFIVTRAGVFDYIPTQAPSLRGRNTNRLGVLRNPEPAQTLIATSRVGQITGSTDANTCKTLVDPIGWPLLTDIGRWGAIGTDLGALTEHNNRLYIFFGDTATNHVNPPINSDMVVWTEAKSVLRHGGHIPIGWEFFLPFEPTGIQGQTSWRFCEKCHSLFFLDASQRGVCPRGGSHQEAGERFVIPFEPSPVSGQPGWRFCPKCSGMFWDRDQRFKGTCPAGGSHDAVGLTFVLPFKAAPDAPVPPEGQGGWRLCQNCNGLHWDGYAQKGVCAGASGGGFHLQAVLDPDTGVFDKFHTDEPIGFLSSLEVPNGAFSFDGRVYVFGGITSEKYNKDFYRPTQPAIGQYLFSKDDPSTPGSYKTDFLLSPIIGRCATDQTHSSLQSHRILGEKFVLHHDLPISPALDTGWRSCKKCHSMFWDGDPNFKGVCQVQQPNRQHEVDPVHNHPYSFIHTVPQDDQNQSNWRRCQHCLVLYYDGFAAKGLCPAFNDGRGHTPTGPVLRVAHASIKEDHKNQRNWRFCGKCKSLFWDGGDFKGVCPKDQTAHQRLGYEFVLAVEVGEDERSQTNWRFCAKCAGLYFDGYIDKGRCPKDGKGHQGAGYHFSLGHGFSETSDRQPKWRFCSQCSILYYDGFDDKGTCPNAPPGRSGHNAAGLDFALRHNPGQISYSENGDWRFCTQCFGMVRADQPIWIPIVSPWVVENARHFALPQNTELGLVMIGYDWGGQFRLAWMPLTAGQRPRFDSIQYFHARKREWSSDIDADPGYALFARPYGGYTHVSTAWLAGPEQWIVLYSNADGEANSDKPIVARFSKNLVDWSDEIALFDPMRDQARGVYMHVPGKDTMHPNIPPSQPPGSDKPGWAYGAFLINRFTTWDLSTRVLGIYYLLSTSSPYQVHVVQSLLRLP